MILTLSHASSWIWVDGGKENEKEEIRAYGGEEKEK
jgi:hypothetical protein